VTTGVGAGRYTLFAEIASGEMASVHLGRLLSAAGSSRTVAIERLYPQFANDPRFVARFHDEARLAARIKHPNVVPTLDLVQEDDQLFLVTEYFAGETLSRLSKTLSAQGVRFEPSVACAVLVGALNGLHAAHEAKNDFGEPLGIVHGEVSQHNVHVGVDGVARMVDFGFAKAMGQAHERRGGEVKGGAYLSPEQIRGATVTRAADVWGASVVLWELLSGTQLFAGDNDALAVRRVLSGEIPDLSQSAQGFPRALEGIVQRGMSRDPAQRFPTARAMASAIEEAVSLAPPSEVGKWVEHLCGDLLAQRTERIREVESSSGTLGGTGVVPSAEFIADALSWNDSKPKAKSSPQPTRPKANIAPGASVRPARSSRPLDIAEVAEVAVARPPPTPRPRGRRALWAWGAGGLAMGGLALILGSVFVPSYAKREAIRAAAARGVSLEIDEANGGYTAIHLHRVRATLPDVPGVAVTISDVDVELDWLRPQRAEVHSVDLALDGPFAKTVALLTLWYRGHRTDGEAGAPLDGLLVEVSAGHVVWTHAFSEDGRIEVDNLSGELQSKGTGRFGDQLHLTTSKLTLIRNATTIGPWRLDLEEDPNATTVRVAFDPPVPDGPSAILSRLAGGKTQLDVNIPRSPLYRLGISPLSLASIKQIPEQAAMRLHYVRSADDHIDAALTATFFGVKGPPMGDSLDLHVSGSVAGAGSAPLDLQGGTLTVGPARATLTGLVNLRPDSMSANLAWKTLPIPCAQLLPGGQKAATDLAVQLGGLGAGKGDLTSLGLDVTALAEAAGVAKVAGNLSASGTIAFDSDDPAHTVLTVVPKNSCGVALFAPH